MTLAGEGGKIESSYVLRIHQSPACCLVWQAGVEQSWGNFDGACPNCLLTTKKFIRVPT